MTIYNINRGIGWASSGVEYAQAYRAGIFRKIGQEAKFIFTDLFQGENLAHFTANIGFENQEVIWLYTAFTDIKTAPTTYSLVEFEASLEEGFQQTNQTEEVVSYRLEGKELVAQAFLRKNHPDKVQRVEYLSKGKLIRKDYFSYTKVFSEFYAPKEDKPHLYLRVFYNEDGSRAYEEICDGDQSIFRFPDAFLFTKEELLGRLLDQLQLTAEDILIVDRATGTGQAIFRHKGQAKVVVIIHAEHYSAGAVTEDTILWNNFYDYQFTNADQVDAFIASTETQKVTLERQFEAYTPHRPKIYALPVGSLDCLRGQERVRRPFSLVTCSRLASEKHIDWLVEAVVLAKQSLPDLTFDIYGEGGQRGLLTELIDKHQAGAYIQLKGHHDLTEVYQDYQVYLTASTSEGFGLTLMEAIGSGLPLIGLDVAYGNQTFVIPGENGILLPRLSPDDSKVYAQAFAQSIVDVFQHQDLASWHRASYVRAEDFLTSRLEASWLQFIQEVRR